MRAVPLYPDGPPRCAVRLVAAVSPTPLCEGCKLHTLGDRRGLMADGEPGGLLVVTPPPTEIDARAGVPLWGRVGRAVRALIDAAWDGPVRYVPAVRCPCPPSKRPNGPLVKEVLACRERLAWDIEAGSTRIFALGKTAVRVVTGRSVHVGGLSGGWAYLDGDSGPPVAYTSDPFSARMSRFAWRRYEHDIQRALTEDPPPPPPTDGVVYVIETPADAATAAESLRRGGQVTFDVESVGKLHTAGFTLISLAAGNDDGLCYQWDEAALVDPDTTAPLCALLGDRTVPKCAQNAKYDFLAAEQHLGVRCCGLVSDPRLASRLLDSDGPADLDTMNEQVAMGEAKGPAAAKVAAACKRLRAADIAAGREPLAARGYKAFAYDALGDDMLAAYNARDVISTSRVAAKLARGLAAVPPVAATYKRTVMPAAEALVRVERAGFPVDVERLRAFGDEIRAAIPPIHERLVAMAPGVDFGAPKQLGELLYGDSGFGAAVKRKTKTGNASVDATALEGLAKCGGKIGAFCGDLLEWRGLTKMLSTYVEGLLPFALADGRIHPTIDPAGATSGRLSCSQPNLTNIPARSDLGKRFRLVFRPDHGGWLLEMDYSQLELRVAAARSGDEVLLDMFRRGVDPHMETARNVSQIVWGIPPEAATREHRSRTKAIVFGALYDKSVHGFAEDFGVPVAEAERLMELVMGRFDGIKAWRSESHDHIRATGVSWTYWDGQRARRRLLPDAGLVGDSLDIRRRRDGIIRSGWNSETQGSASDLCLSAVVESVDWLDSRPDLEAEVVLSVHDSIVAEGRNWATLREVAAGIEAIMIDQPLACPLAVEGKAGPSWGEMEVLG